MIQVIISSIFRLKETLRENMTNFKSKYAYVVGNVQKVINYASYKYKQSVTLYVHHLFSLQLKKYTVFK